MNLELKDYQLKAAQEAVDEYLIRSERFQKFERRSAISISAPTGAGKTVIATAIIEDLMFGTLGSVPNPDLTVIWVSNDPSLNQQTRSKMLVGSNRLGASQLVTVTQTLDQRILDRGKVYFVHVQQLGKGAHNYVSIGTHRRWSLWETLHSTMKERSTNVLLIVDEAHRGTGVRADGEGTTLSRIMDGDDRKSGCPLVLGISATPQKFTDYIGKSRVVTPIEVDPDDVRASGLIKDKILLRNPGENQPGDSTLLGMAVEDIKSYDTSWHLYSAAQDDAAVKPILVAQVPAAASDSLLDAIITKIKDVWPSLTDRAFTHSFQDHTPKQVGLHSVRYVAPQDIQDDLDARVVLFKEALTTGWDCPRAEVLISFRKASDITYITQLIGRMVRTPLARRIASNDVLNSVAVYLPEFDSVSVDQVVLGIRNNEDVLTSEPEVDPIVCDKNIETPTKVWDLLADLPTYTRSAKSYRNEVVRLESLSLLLARAGLLEYATDTALTSLVHALADFESQHLSEVAIVVADFENLTFQTRVVSTLEGKTLDSEMSDVHIDAGNLDDLFKVARRRFGSSVAIGYLNHLCDNGMDPDDAKFRVSALSAIPSAVEAVESAAKRLVSSWRHSYAGAASRLREDLSAKFQNVWEQGKDPQEIRISLPDKITASAKYSRYPKHLYSAPGGYPTNLNGWESKVLEEELTHPSLLAWYRNPTNGQRALSIPYPFNESPNSGSLYPDFLFFHDTDDGLRLDIVDPHRVDLGDTSAKWRALSLYAQANPVVKRALGVIETPKGEVMMLDLLNLQVSAKLARLLSEEEILGLFQDYGALY